MVEPPLWTPGQGDDPDTIDISLNLIGQGAIDAITSLTNALERLERLNVGQGSTGRGAGSAYDRQNAGSQPPDRDPRDRPDNASRPQGQPFRVSPMTGEGQGQLFDAQLHDQASRPPTSAYKFRTRTDGSIMSFGTPFEKAAYQDSASRIPTTDWRLQDQMDQMEPAKDNASRRPVGRAIAMGRMMAAQSHRGGMHSALSMAGNVALLKGVVGEGEGGGGGFMQSMMGSVAAQRMMGGGANASGGGGAGFGRAIGIAQEAAGAFAIGNLLHSRMSQSFAQPGTALGYDRGMQLNIPGTQLGVQTPFTGWHGVFPEIGRDSAFRQEIDRRVNSFRLRLQGGINGRQANEIMNSLAGSGFSGQGGENVAFDAVAPLVRQGQDPGLASDMVTHAIRNGNANLEDVRVTLDNLGESARTARMTLNEYQEGLDQTAETMQNLGAFRNQAVEVTRQLTDSTGLTPQQITPIAQSSLFQAMAFQNSGVMPNAVGAQSGGMFAGNVSRTVDFAMRAATPFAHETRDPTTGDTISARQNQLIQAAQFAGMPLETFARLQRNAQRLPALAKLRGSISGFERSIQDAGHVREQLDSPARITGGDPRTRHLREMQRQWRSHKDEANTAIDSSLVTQNWAPVHEALLNAAPGKAGVHSKERDSYFRRISDIEKMDDPTERLNATRKLLRDQAQQAVPEDRPVVKLDLTPEARKLVRQVQQENDSAKRTARRGGPPVNVDRSQPDQNQGP